MGDILSTYFKLRESFNFDDNNTSNNDNIMSTARSNHNMIDNGENKEQRKIEIIKSIDNQKVS